MYSETSTAVNQDTKVSELATIIVSSYYLLAIRSRHICSSKKNQLVNQILCGQHMKTKEMKETSWNPKINLYNLFLVICMFTTHLKFSATPQVLPIYDE